MTSRSDIEGWLQRADTEHTHMIVVCDTFSHDDYPVFVRENQNAKEVVAEYDGPNMQRVMEVYNLDMDINSQIDEIRCYHL